ncbi:hypothetical protein VKT23_019999 [Stygiomarasmius scandens]|uniref:Uncharacterized protein n=1 Tax=Marasmiellus scandens TaxID=2682957 RepID=A0ABR1IJZ7_9AGAR
MTDRHTRSQGPAPEISLPPTRRSTSLPPGRRSRTPASGTQTPASGTQTHTPPVSSTSQPQPQILTSLPFPLSPILDMSHTGEPETSTQNPEGPAPPTPNNPPATPVQNTPAPPTNLLLQPILMIGLKLNVRTVSSIIYIETQFRNNALRN